MKQRLVGAVVLVALGVIFIPMLLSGGGEVDIPKFGSNVPPVPDKIKNIKSFDLNAQHQSQTKAKIPEVLPVQGSFKEPASISSETEKTATGKTNAAKSRTKDTPKAPVSRTADKQKEKKPHGWVVQVGSFNKQDNAIALRNKLRRNKFSAFVERVAKSTGAIYRVRVGPEARQEDAQTLATKLLKKMALKGLVVKHP